MSIAGVIQSTATTTLEAMQAFPMLHVFIIPVAFNVSENILCNGSLITGHSVIRHVFSDPRLKMPNVQISAEIMRKDLRRTTILGLSVVRMDRGEKVGQGQECIATNWQ